MIDVPWSKVAILGMVIPPLIGNPYNRYIKPYYWVDDHPLLYGNNGNLDPGTDVPIGTFVYLPSHGGLKFVGKFQSHGARFLGGECAAVCLFDMTDLWDWANGLVRESPQNARNLFGRMVYFPAYWFDSIKINHSCRWIYRCHMDPMGLFFLRVNDRRCLLKLDSHVDVSGVVTCTTIVLVGVSCLCGSQLCFLFIWFC